MLASRAQRGCHGRSAETFGGEILIGRDTTCRIRYLIPEAMNVFAIRYNSHENGLLARWST